MLYMLYMPVSIPSRLPWIATRDRTEDDQGWTDKKTENDTIQNTMPYPYPHPPCGSQCCCRCPDLRGMEFGSRYDNGTDWLRTEFG